MTVRPIFLEEHEQFRDSVRRFVQASVVPHHRRWEAEGRVPRELWLEAGAAGLLCTGMPEEYGGSDADFRFSTIIIEELSKVGAHGPGFSLHSDIVAPYILHYGSEAQKRHWLPRMARGEIITAIAMTEPGTGSDLAGVRTRATRDGNGYVLNGAKTFITNGQNADLIIVVAKTDPEAGARGTSLFLVDAGLDGFARGKNLDKLGMDAQDTSELFFDDVRLSGDDLLGEEGRGFIYLMSELPQERLIVALGAVTSAETAVEQTIAYVRERKAFGAPIATFQNTKFVLADLLTETRIGRVFVDDCLARHIAGGLDPETAAMAKLWLTEMQGRVLDQCLQLHGGYGYMKETPVARAWADARVQRIYGGTSEIMRELIGRSILPDRAR